MLTAILRVPVGISAFDSGARIVHPVVDKVSVRTGSSVNSRYPYFMEPEALGTALEQLPNKYPAASSGNH